jgi:glycolate oxidase FAD binding subunit
MPSIPDTSDDILPATQSELARWVAENAAGAQKAICPAGGRTSLSFGPPPTRPGITVSTTELARIIDYPARDMTITVEAGIRLTELARALSAENQRLPVDAPLPHRATLGGLVATNTSSSRRYGQGTIRDYVIGLSAVDASGRLFRAGGRVVKNVAGYDLCKLMCGSFGTLAIITQITLKLKPTPEASRLLWCAFDHLTSIDRALEKLTSSATRPVSIDVLDARAAATIAGEADVGLPVNRPVFCVGVEGTRKEVDWQLETLHSELRPFAPHSMDAVTQADSDSIWFALTGFQLTSDDPLTFKAGLRPSRVIEFVQQAASLGCSIVAHVGNGIVHGHLPDSVTSAEAACKILEPLHAMIQASEGSLSIDQCDPAWRAALPGAGDSPRAGRLMTKIKRALDPMNLLNPGRLVAFE